MKLVSSVQRGIASRNLFPPPRFVRRRAVFVFPRARWRSLFSSGGARGDGRVVGGLREIEWIGLGFGYADRVAVYMAAAAGASFLVDSPYGFADWCGGDLMKKEKSLWSLCSDEAG